MSTLARVKLSSKGQVVIPAAVRKKLGLKQHDELQVRVEQDRIILMRVVRHKKGWEDLEGSLAGGRSLTKCLEEERQREKEREEKKLRRSSTPGQS